MCWDELLSLEVEYGKPTLTTATALSTFGLLGNGICLPLFHVLKIPKHWAKFPFVVRPSYMWWILYSRGAQGCAWRPHWCCGVWGAGWGKANRASPLSQVRHTQAPPALAEDAQENHREALLKLVLQDRAASRSLNPAAAAGVSVVDFLKAHSSIMALEMKRWMPGC